MGAIGKKKNTKIKKKTVTHLGNWETFSVSKLLAIKSWTPQLRSPAPMKMLSLVFVLISIIFALTQSKTYLGKDDLRWEPVYILLASGYAHRMESRCDINELLMAVHMIVYLSRSFQLWKITYASLILPLY